MTSITQGGTTEKLYYDPFGSLVQRQVGTTVVSYVGRRATVTGTLASGCQTPSCGVVVSAVDFHVTLGAGRRIASVRVYGAARTLYYHRDRLGSVVATTRDGGLGGASYRYSANGALEVALSDSGDSASEIGYAGSLRLSGGLLSMGARVYNPALKIWMQPDPLQPLKYDYADGDPVNRIDPSGLESQLVMIIPVSLPGIGRTYLDINMAATVDRFSFFAAEKGVELQFNSAYRSPAAQRALQGDPSAITPASTSLHSTGNAVDVQFNSLRDIPGGLTGDEQRAAILEAAETAGLKWGGEFSNPDPPHFYLDPFSDLSQRREAIEQAWLQMKAIQWAETDQVP
jgi:RHS repeat-associated protein